MHATRNVKAILFTVFCSTILAETKRGVLSTSCRQRCFTDIAKKSAGIRVGYNPQSHSILECLKQCLKDEGPPEMRIQILGPKDKVPANLHMPKKIPPFPIDLGQENDLHIPNKSDCSNAAVGSKDEPVPGPVKIKSVSCETTDEGDLQLVVQWSKPKEGSEFLQGYQIFYRFANADSEVKVDNHCKVINKEAKKFIIDKKHGFCKGPVSVGVKALPTESSFKLHLQEFKGCRGTKEKPRSRRSFDPMGLFPGDQTNRSSKEVILGPGATLPPGLVMPTQLVRPTLGRFEKNRTCGPPMLERRTTAILGVLDLRLKCEDEHNSSGKIGYAQWSMAGIPSDKYTGFQILYSVMLDYNYDPTKTFCIEVGPGVRSVLIDDGLSENIKVRLNVAPLPIYSGQQLELNTYYCSMPSPAISPDPPPVRSTPLAAILGGIAALVAVAAAFATWLFRRQKKSKTEIEATEIDGPTAYFSHCHRSDRDVRRLLTFADRLTSSYGIRCCIDLLEQRVIDLWTLPVWCNTRLAESDKVIVVVDKKYLKTWDEHVKSKTTERVQNDVEVCKILNELYYIQQHLMENIERTAKVICLLSDGVQRTELPDFLRRRPVINWPCTDQAMADFVRCIKGVENNVLSF